MPQFRLRDLPCSSADGSVEIFSVNGPTPRCLRRCCDDRHYRHIIIVKCDRAADALDRFQHIEEKGVPVCTGERKNAFDVIVTRNLTWDLPHPESAYREWHRVLRSGGILLNFDANWYRYQFDSFAREAYDEDRVNATAIGI